MAKGRNSVKRRTRPQGPVGEAAPIDLLRLNNVSDVLFSFQNNQEDRYTRASCKNSDPLWPLGGGVGPQKSAGPATIDADQGGDD